MRNSTTRNRTQCTIRSKLHNVETVKQTKVALSSNDDKRYLRSDSTDTYAWGHYKINNVNNDQENNVAESMEIDETV